MVSAGMRIAVFRGMPRPRPVLEAKSLFITRRVAGRQFRLRPDKKTTAIVRYLLAVLGEAFGIEFNAITVMSNHWHATLFDQFGNIDDFTREFHSMSARVLNRAWGDSESLWASAQTSHVHPELPDDTIGRICYTRANPVKAGLVTYSERWKGVCESWPTDPRELSKPKGFFREGKKEGDGRVWPEKATLRFHRPRGFAHLTDADLETEIAEQLLAEETKAREAVFASGREFCGFQVVLKQSRYAKAKSSEKSDEKRRNISPRIACKDPALRIARINADRLWLAQYEDARDRFNAGERDVVFPLGTNKMRVLHNVRIAPS